MEEEKVTSEYFQSIDYVLSSISMEAPWADQVLGQLRVLKTDVRFLGVFCFCLETWDYTTDEESMEKWRSMITPLTMIWTYNNWTEQLQVFFLEIRLAEARTIDISIQHFHSAMLELEAKIQQSKSQVEGWCEYLMNSSIQCKSTNILCIWKILQYIRENLNLFPSYGAAKFVLLKKKIDILNAMISFLKGQLDDVERRPYTKENLQFLNFICDFSNKTACLTCLYWAKEAHEEMEIEMNIAVFNMLQKFIPCASEITPLYIGILKSYDLQPSDSFLMVEAVESFVDFFFDHLAFTLKDDFLIIRDGLIFLFTFLTDPPPCENAEEEESIRNHINALFQEDAYLFLPFDDMYTDFSNKKMLLSHCMIKINIANSKIRQLYCGFFYSWIRLEVEKMEYTVFISVHRELSWIEKNAKWAEPLQGQLKLYRMELRFIRMFLVCFKTWDDADEEMGVRLNSMFTSLQGIWEREGNGPLAHRLYAIRTGSVANWHPLASELERKFQLSKLEIEAWWESMFHLSFRFKPSTTLKILKCLDSILDNLNYLVNYKAGEIVSFKKQIETLEMKLVLVKNFLKLTLNCTDGMEFREFNMFVQVIINDAACLSFLYWAKDVNDEVVHETNYMLSRMLQKIKPVTPDVARLYFETLEAIYMQRSDSHMFGQTAFSFVDFFLEDLVTPLNDDFRILQENIIFLLIFLNDPPSENEEEIICSQIDILFWEYVYRLLPFDDIQGDFSEKKVLLNDFMMRIEIVNANIRQLYCKFPDSSLYNFPKVISPYFLDSIIQNLRTLEEWMIIDQRYAPFAKYKITRIEEELVSLCPFFNHIFDLQSELKETWLEVVNLVHLTELVVNLWISSWVVYDQPIWYHMAYLSHVFDELKVVKTKLQKITVYNAKSFPRSLGLISTISEQSTHSKSNEIVVGFEDEAEKIIGKLTIRGHMPLDIVSIVGMGGLGKTTLARKVYGSASVKCNFNVFAFCTVSQDHNTRKLLLDILCDIKGVDGNMSNMTDDDLAHQLRKCLSRQKYLIVLDDIWNACVWNKVKNSFPDDKNGSIVMFTTRSREIANKCKIRCSPYELRFLSKVESWELLQKMVFQDGTAPAYLNEIGKSIANYCKGLPLAVVVIAGLLSRTEKTFKWWSEVEKRVVDYLYDEGCMKILELSYQHLPDNLKPCLLYLGAFPEDTLINVKKLILLWIAEGFVQESKTKSLEDVAKDYFHDLVGRSLIIVSARNSIGEIKTFRIHDLIHELCQRKCRDGNFFLLNHGIASSSSYDPSINNHYRVSMQKQSDFTAFVGSSLSYPRSVLYFCYYEKRDFNFKKFRLAQVLDLDRLFINHNVKELCSLVHMRHVHAHFVGSVYIPSSLSDLWNIGSLTLEGLYRDHLPETFWRMKSLRHVKVRYCILKFPYYHKPEAYPKLDKLVSFSSPFLHTGKDVQQLLQMCTAVKTLGCCLNDSPVNDKESHVETLDFDSKIEWLKLWKNARRTTYSINFPSTLKRLTLVKFQLSLTDISAIAKLNYLQVLKLKWCSFMEERLDIEDITFRNLKYFELYNNNDLVECNACTESLPCLEQLVIECRKLEDLPPCFGEMSTLKRIFVRFCSEVVESSALRIKEEHRELGNEVEVSIKMKGGGSK